MAPPSIVGALLGGYVSGVLPRRALLAVISVVLFHAAFELFVRPPAPAPDESGRVAAGPRSSPARSSASSAASWG